MWLIFVLPKNFLSHIRNEWKFYSLECQQNDIFNWMAEKVSTKSTTTMVLKCYTIHDKILCVCMFTITTTIFALCECVCVCTFTFSILNWKANCLQNENLFKHVVCTIHKWLRVNVHSVDWRSEVNGTMKKNKSEPIKKKKKKQEAHAESNSTFRFAGDSMKLNIVPKCAHDKAI